MVHFFNTNVAEIYGVNAAILLENITFWVDKNRANEQNYYDGKYWTYNSIKAFCALFPYMTERVIRTSLQRLIDDGLLETGNYNADQRDRTLWYSVTEKGYQISQNGQMHLPSRANANSPEGKALPDNKLPDNKLNNPPKSPHGGTDGVTDTGETDFDRFWKAYPRKVGKQTALKAFRKVNTPLETLLNAIEVQKRSKQWQKDNGQFIPHPTTWLNQWRWEDEVNDSADECEASEKALRGARWLEERVRERVPEMRPLSDDTLAAMAQDIDHLNTVDGYEWDTIGDVMQFSQEDPFWRKTVIDTAKLRSNFGQLLSAMHESEEREDGS